MFGVLEGWIEKPIGFVSIWGRAPEGFRTLQNAPECAFWIRCSRHLHLTRRFDTDIDIDSTGPDHRQVLTMELVWGWRWWPRRWCDGGGCGDCDGGGCDGEGGGCDGGGDGCGCDGVMAVSRLPSLTRSTLGEVGGFLE